MAHLHTLMKDEAPGPVEGREGFKTAASGDGADCAPITAGDKRKATARARAALLGLRLTERRSGEWLVIAKGDPVATMPSLQAAEGMLYGLEQDRAEVAAMVAALASPEGVR